MGRSDAVITRLVRVPLTDGQRAALISFLYNEGPGGFTAKNGQPTGILSKLNARNYARAANEFPKWNISDGRVLAGLVRRRALERSVFEGRVVLLAGEGGDGWRGSRASAGQSRPRTCPSAAQAHRGHHPGAARDQRGRTERTGAGSAAGVICCAACRASPSAKLWTTFASWSGAHGAENLATMWFPV